MKRPIGDNPLRSPKRRTTAGSNQRHLGANRRAASDMPQPSPKTRADETYPAIQANLNKGPSGLQSDTYGQAKSPTLTKRKQRMSQNSTGVDGFPPLELWATVANIYQAFFIHLPRILRLAIIPFIVSTIAYALGDLYLGATHVNNDSFWVISVIVQCVEVFLFYLYSLSVYRLMLLGNWESLIWFDSQWRNRFFAYAVRSFSVFLPLMIVTIGSYLAIRFLISSVSTAFVYTIPFIVIGYFWLFLRLSFALPAASVDAPYSIRDSWRATKLISFRVLMIGILTVGPPLLLFVTSIYTLNSIEPGIEAEIADGVAYTINPSYWFITPVGIMLSYLLASFVVISTAIMFYYRTGWRPGAIRADK